jgi:Ankyrin repeats (3 copies)
MSVSHDTLVEFSIYRVKKLYLIEAHTSKQTIEYTSCFFAFQETTGEKQHIRPMLQVSLPTIVTPTTSPIRHCCSSAITPYCPWSYDPDESTSSINMISDHVLGSIDIKVHVPTDLSHSGQCSEQHEQIVSNETMAKKSKIIRHSASPQDYLDAMIFQRGYSTERYPTLDSGYHNEPTSLQESSYRPHVLSLVDENDIQSLRSLLMCGLSNNPSNYFGSTLAHYVCRVGRVDLLRMLIETGCDLRVADGAGRTPLHEACKRKNPCFDIVEIIMKNDIRLFHMVDSHGTVPLARVPKDCWDAWNDFLEAKKDVYWPQRDYIKYGDEPPPPLTLVQPNTRLLTDPRNTLPIQTVQQLASGQICPDDVSNGIGENEVAKYRSSFLNYSYSKGVTDRAACSTIATEEETTGSISVSDVDGNTRGKEALLLQRGQSIGGNSLKVETTQEGPRSKSMEPRDTTEKNCTFENYLVPQSTNPFDSFSSVPNGIYDSFVVQASNDIQPNISNTSNDRNCLENQKIVPKLVRRESTDIRKSLSVPRTKSNRMIVDLDDSMDDDDDDEIKKLEIQKKKERRERRRAKTRSPSKRRKKRPSFYIERVAV